MIKKIILLLFVLLIVMAGLQLFADRDFSQLSVAWDKYQHGGDVNSLTSDVGSVFAGEALNEGGLATAQLAEHVFYRWTDDKGVVHNSERMPDVENFEVIKMGDLKIETQKAMDKEEIKRALKDG